MIEFKLCWTGFTKCWAYSLPVYAKTYNWMTNGNDVCLRIIAHVCRCTCISTYTQWCWICLYVYPCTVSCPGENRFFSCFSKAHFSKWLEQFCFTVLLHTATIIKTSMILHFFVLEWMLQVCPKFKFPFSWWKSRNGRVDVIGLPQIKSSIQLVKIEKRVSKLNCHEESTCNEEFVAGV